MSTKAQYVKDNVINLKGKEYLQVAHRVVMFRREHPDWAIYTDHLTIGDDLYMVAQIMDVEGGVIAKAHKRVQTKGRGAAADWPLETAETGAIGRALALCGYGTLSGDLDEGDQLADAPVSVTPTPAAGPDLYKAALAMIAEATTAEELQAAKEYIETNNVLKDKDLKAAYRAASQKVSK